MDIKELRSREFENVERYSRAIDLKLRDIDIMPGTKIISTAYLAYLAKKEKLSDAKKLMNFVNEKLPESQAYFLKDGSSDSYWSIVLEISKEFTTDALLAVVLWHSNKNAGKYRVDTETPYSLVKLAYEILSPKSEKVADLCCGIGSFLSYAALQNENCSLYGVELNSRVKEISDIRLSLYNNETEVEQCSALEIPEEKKFDKIFCHFPWNVKSKFMLSDERKIDTFSELIPEIKKSPTADWYFILNTVKHLNDDGKAVVLTTNGITWNGGASKEVREKFIKMGFLEAVIALPANMFSSTSIATSMLVLGKDNYKSVRFVDASGLATIGRRQNEFSDEAIASILKMLASDGEFSKEVEISEIAKMDYMINPSRYLQKEIKVENGVPFEDLIKKITRGVQIRASVLDEMASDTPTAYQYLKLSDIQDGIINDELPYIRAIDKKQEKYCLKNNDLIISKNGAPVKVAVASVKEGQQILANGNLYIIELDETKANPYFVKAYLESEQGMIALSRITVGATLSSIPVESLKKMLIPNPAMEYQNEIAEKYLTKVDEIKVLRYRLQKATSELKTIYEEG